MTQFGIIRNAALYALCRRRHNAQWLLAYSSRTLVGSTVMPIGVLEVNPAIPHAALCTMSLGGSFASYMLLRNSLAEPLFRLLRKLFHGELPQIGSPGL